MKNWLAFIGVAAMVSWVGPSSAADDPMAGLYGNTLTCQGPTWGCHYWYASDHTFIAFSTGTTKDGATTFSGSEGTWAIENNKLCRHPMPAPATPSPCTDWEFNKKVGDKWEHTSGRGTEYFTLVEGHH